jgi:hypothetical protein
MKIKSIKIGIRDTGGLFSKVDDVAIIIKTKSGVHRQVDVYVRGKVLYASIGSGFVSLSTATYQSTSSTSYKWVEFIPLNNKEFEYVEPPVGFLELP